MCSVVLAEEQDGGHFIILFKFCYFKPSLNNINEYKMCSSLKHFFVAVKEKERVRHPEHEVVCMNKLSMHKQYRYTEIDIGQEGC